MNNKQAEVVCLHCGQRVPVVLKNGEYRRLYHHGRGGRMCSGSSMPVITSTVLFKEKA